MRARVARFTAILQALLLMGTLVLPALVAATEISTDLWIYQYGDTVTVTGIDFGADEDVSVVTTDPYGTGVDSGVAHADANGGFTYSFTLLSDVPGIYDVVATGQTSGLTAATQFDPPSTIAFTFPAATVYTAATFNAGCSTVGGDLCGTAQAGQGNLTKVEFSLQEGLTGNYWNGTDFTSASLQKITIFTGNTASVVTWSVTPFAATNFPSDGAYTLTIYTTQSGSPQANTAARAFAIDRTAPGAPPKPSITGSTPGSPSSNTNPTINGTAESGTTVKISKQSDCGGSVEGSAYTTGSFSIPVSVGTNSSTTFYATATDASGNVSACSTTSVAYNADNNSPSVTLNTTPTNPTASTAAGFTFTSSDGGGPGASGVASVECRLDSPTWGACTSSTTFVATVGAGPHTFGVRATDNAGNVGSATTYSWIVTTPDSDGDGINDADDNCPSIANTDQADNDGDNVGDACDSDDDNDSVTDGSDNCPFTANAGQTDTDGDLIGDACDGDIDGDGVLNDDDNCPSVANADQADNDGDNIGDACDADDDDDGVADGSDNCPFAANADQADNDGDGLGLACDDNDYAPIVQTDASNATGDEGDTLATNDGVFTDGDGNHTLSITKYSGDGDVVDNGDGTWSWSLATTDNGSGTVCVRADDGDTGHADAEDCFDWAAANVAPTATIGNDGPINEGSSATVSLTGASDPSSADTTAGFHYAFSCTNGDLSAATYAGSSATASTSCPFDDGTQNYTVKVRIIDKDGGFTEYTTAVTVNNVAPTATIGNDGPINEGSSATVSLTGASDPSSADTTAGLHYAFSCSNGDLSAATYASAGTTASTSCLGVEGPSTFTVKARIIDKDGGFTEYTTVVTVNNVAPTVTAASFGATVAGCGANNASLTISFTDPGALDTHTVDIDWGDGSAHTTGVVTTGQTFAHTYATGGPYTAAVVVTDDEGDASPSLTSTNTVSVGYQSALGITQPINYTGPRSLFKHGSTIPVKLQVQTCAGVVVTTADLRIRALQLSGVTPSGVDEVPPATGNANTDGHFRYDASGMQYIYNLSTKLLTSDGTSTWRIYVDAYLPGGAIQSGFVTAEFGLKK